MSDMMTFPETWEEYEKIFGFYDEDGVYYSSNTRLIPSFRVKQWLDHLPSAEPEVIRCKDCKHWVIDGCKDTGCLEYDFCSYAERRGEADE